MKIKPGLLLLLALWATVSTADPVSDFSLPGLDGKEYRLGQYTGKWVIINYWATDCPPCVKEIPELVAFDNRHRDVDAVVLGVNYEDIKRSWLMDFIESMKMSYPVLLAKPDTPTPFGPIVMLPTTYIISPQGRFMGQQRGAITAEALEKYLEGQTGDVQHTTRNEYPPGSAP